MRTLLGRYELGRVLGSGGAGRVHEAEWIGPAGFRKPVALKVLHEQSDGLKREARLGGLLRHQHLVDVYEVGEVDGRWFCAMELCAGTLADRLPLPPRAVVEVGLAVCDALQYAHEQLGLVHLDLKPANLMYTADGTVKLGDLGIARAQGFDRDARIRGTPGYMAPEQRRGGELDPRTDVYALGVTLVELATGVRPGASTTLETYSADRTPSAETVHLEDFVEEVEDDWVVPDWLEPAVGRCLEWAVEDRWPDMRSLAGALRQLAVGGTGLRRALDLAPVVHRAADPHTNLSTEAESLLGRDAELEALAKALEEPGLYTLRGPAGVGKSSLAGCAARAWRRRTGAPAWFVELADARTETGVGIAVARAMGLALGGSDPVERIGEHLAGAGPMIAVLDNFEQLVDVASVVERWRAGSPELRLLITSQRALGLDGERVIDLAPLDEAAAIALIRARALQRGVELGTPERLDELARRLDGLPLALELAAGRLGVLTVDDVLERLDLSLLRRGTADRHATLRDAMTWSWELLDPTEQSALAQLSVFSGGFRLEAAEEVLAVDRAPLDVVEALVERSLLAVAHPGRLRMLVSVQALASEKLDELGLRDAAEIRHGQWAASQGTWEGLAALDQHGGAEALSRFGLELDNLLVACRRAIARQDCSVAVDALRGAWAVVGMQGPFAVARDLALEVLELEGLDRLQRAEAYRVAGVATDHLGDRDSGRRYYELAVRATEAGGHPKLLGSVLSDLAVSHHDSGESREAIALYQRSLPILLDAGARRFAGIVYGNLAVVYHELAEPRRALELYEQALAIHREVGNQRYEAGVLASMAALHAESFGQIEEGAEMCRQVIEVYRDLGDHKLAAIWLGNLGSFEHQLGQSEAARAHLEEALAEHRSIGNRLSEAATLGNLGVLCHAMGDAAAAVEHLEAALQMHRAIQNRRYVGWTLAQLARLWHEAGEADRAAAAWDEADEQLQGVDPLIRGETLAVRAKAVAADDPDAAVGYLERARVLAERIGVGPESNLGRMIREAQAP